tara:strand:+ start:997 stop:1236 length:240 start_codon:yes stop_codon:yes gene_type:complete
VVHLTSLLAVAAGVLLVQMLEVVAAAVVPMLAFLPLMLTLEILLRVELVVAAVVLLVSHKIELVVVVDLDLSSSHILPN